MYCSLIQDTRYKRQSVNCCTHCVSLIQADTLRTTAWPTTRELLQVADRDRRSASERQTCRSIRTASVYSGCPLNVGRPLTGRALTRLTVLYYWPTALIALCRLTVYYWSAAINTWLSKRLPLVLFLDTSLAWNDHPQMARSRPLYTIWSRGQMTASWMFTSVTTATSITRTFNFRNITTVSVFELVHNSNYTLYN